MNKRTLFRLSNIGLILVGLCLPLRVGAQQNLPTVLVRAAEQVNLFEEVPLTGTVVSPRIAELSTEVAGLVAEVAVELGDRVRAGEPILRLNADLETLALEAARASTERARHELEDAQRRLAEARRLGQNQSVSVTESLAAEVKIDGAELQRYEAEQKRQAARLARYRLTAPFAGVVSRKLVEPGEWLQPGDSVIELVALDGLRIDFQVPQSAYARLDQSTGLDIRLDALPGEHFAGRIERVIPVTDPVSRTFRVRTALLEREVPLAPGMSVSAILRLNSDKQGIVVPRDALIRYPDGRVTVWVAEVDGDSASVREQRVRTGIGFAGQVAISDGLAPGDLVVVRGNEALSERQAVVVRDFEKE